MTTVRRLLGLWPLLVLLAAILTVQVAWSSRFSVTGHAAEHLSSATAVFGIAFLTGTVVWAVDAALRRRIELWILAALIVLGSVGVAAGNVEVVDAIGQDTWSFDEAETRGPSRAGFTDGHEVAKRAAWATVAATVALAAWLGIRRAVSPGTAAASAVASVVFPNWILPGAGMVVLAIAMVVARLRGEGRSGDDGRTRARG